MAVLIPESATRLQAVAFVNGAELEVVGRERIIRAAAEKLAESALQKLLADCIKTEGDYMGHPGHTLRLDVYVLSPQELHRIVADAFAKGWQDEARWSERLR